MAMESSNNDKISMVVAYHFYYSFALFVTHFMEMREEIPEK